MAVLELESLTKRFAIAASDDNAAARTQSLLGSRRYTVIGGKRCAPRRIAARLGKPLA